MDQASKRIDPTPPPRAGTPQPEQRELVMTIERAREAVEASRPDLIARVSTRAAYGAWLRALAAVIAVCGEPMRNALALALAALDGSLPRDEMWERLATMIVDDPGTPATRLASTVAAAVTNGIEGRPRPTFARVIADALPSDALEVLAGLEVAYRHELEACAESEGLRAEAAA